MRSFGLKAVGGFAVLLIAVSLSTTAHAQLEYGPFTISGQYSYLLNSNDGHQNPNNTIVPGVRAFNLTNNNHNPMFNYMGQFLQLRIAGRFGRHWDVFLEPEVWDDLTKSVDGHYVQYPSHPWNYRGSGYFLGGGGNDLKAALWQVFVDYRNGPLWIRVGRQSVAWGPAIAMLVLDQVDSLDISDFFFYGRAFDEFEYTRIPELGVRIDYQFPTQLIPDLAVDTFISPGTATPDILPAQGSAYNTIPAILDYRDNTEQGKPIFAARVTGTVHGVDFSVDMITRPNSFPVPIAKGLTSSTQAGLPPSAFGIPPFVHVCGPLCRVYAIGEHPRFWLFGASVGYYFNSLEAMGRFSTVVKPDSPGALTADGTPVKIVRRPVWNSMIDIDRPTYLIPGWSALSISYEMEIIYNMGDIQHVQSLAPNPGANVDSVEVLPAFVLQQPLFNDTLDLEFLGVFDTAGGEWLQPGIHYQLGDHYSFDLYYNSFGGAKSSRFPALHWWADGVWARATYRF